jgi:hypothetical protein
MWLVRTQAMAGGWVLQVACEDKLWPEKNHMANGEDPGRMLKQKIIQALSISFIFSLYQNDDASYEHAAC